VCVGPSPPSTVFDDLLHMHVRLTSSFLAIHVSSLPMYLDMYFHQSTGFSNGTLATLTFYFRFTWTYVLDLFCLIKFLFGIYISTPAGKICHSDFMYLDLNCFCCPDIRTSSVDRTQQSRFQPEDRDRLHSPKCCFKNTQIQWKMLKKRFPTEIITY
jgi:hypothetical protein